MASKPLITGVEKFIILGLVLFFGYGIFQKGGFTVMERTEEVEILDNREVSKSYKKLEREELQSRGTMVRNPSMSSDDVAGKLARTFSKGNSNSTNTKRELGLREDEVNFYEEVKNENTLESKVQDARTWFSILKTSATTYAKVKSFVDDLGGEPVSETDVNELLQKSDSSDDFYNALEKSFGISPAEAKLFSSMGKKKISDWANFIEDKNRKE